MADQNQTTKPAIGFRPETAEKRAAEPLSERYQPLTPEDIASEERVLEVLSQSMPGAAAFHSGISVDVAVALSLAAHDHLNRLGIDCPHDIGLALADALVPFWSQRP